MYLSYKTLQSAPEKNKGVFSKFKFLLNADHIFLTPLFPPSEYLFGTYVHTSARIIK